MLGILEIGCDRCFKKIKPLRAVYGNIDDAKAYGVSAQTVLCVKVWRCGLRILVVTQVNTIRHKTEMAANSQIIYLWTFTYFEGDVR
jgi:hypothetical protein